MKDDRKDLYEDLRETTPQGRPVNIGPPHGATAIGMLKAVMQSTDTGEASKEAVRNWLVTNQVLTNDGRLRALGLIEVPKTFKYAVLKVNARVAYITWQCNDPALQEAIHEVIRAERDVEELHGAAAVPPNVRDMRSAMQAAGHMKGKGRGGNPNEE